MLRRFWLEEAFPLSCADSEAAPALIEQVFKDAELSWPHAEHANVEFVAFDAREQLASITTRSLVLAGAHDTLSVDTVRAIHDGVADSEFVLFENSGHYAPVEEPQRFKSVLLEFLDVEP